MLVINRPESIVNRSVGKSEYALELETANRPPSFDMKRKYRRIKSGREEVDLGRTAVACRQNHEAAGRSRFRHSRFALLVDPVVSVNRRLHGSYLRLRNRLRWWDTSKAWAIRIDIETLERQRSENHRIKWIFTPWKMFNFFLWLSTCTCSGYCSRLMN